MKNTLFILLLLPLFTLAQKKQLTLEDIYKKGTFRSEYVAGFNADGSDTMFNSLALTNESGKKIETSSFELSADKKQALFFNDVEHIYRHSTKATVYLYNVATNKVALLNKGKVLHPTFSPDGSKIAYVFDNNLYIYNIAANTTTAVTTDGKWNYIINGNCDWVYEEEFSFTRAFEWSPAGNYLAYYKFDESNVKEYNMTLFNNNYNVDYRYKYPKAGEENSKVEIHIYNTENGNDVKADYSQGDIYIPRIKWTQSNNELVVFWLNRLQNNLKLLLTNPATGNSQLLYEETNKYYVDITDDWRFLKDGKHFIFTSEMNGYNRLYLYSMDGKKKIELTNTNYDITEINGVDEANGLVYYTLAYPNPTDRNFFVTDFSGKNTKQLTSGNGWHRVELNNDFSRFYDYYSNINTPQQVALYAINKKGKKITAEKKEVVSENAKLKNTLAQYDLGTVQLMKIANAGGDSLNAWMLKPANFDASKKYPVLFSNYGGPGSQQVANRYGAANMWHQLLAQKGFIVVSVDNTGTGYRGEEFKKKTYLRLGEKEINDQIDAAKYLGTLPYIDKNRIGHWGWSFGGFMSSLAITKGADVFKAAIAVAPVTSWMYYDNIYTERFMRTPQQNPEGYKETAPLNYTDKIKGKFLIIHGTGDDNVHFQNSVQMVESMIQNNIDFESAYYPNKNHGIYGGNTTFHLYSKMTEWLLKNLRDNNTPIDELKTAKGF